MMVAGMATQVVGGISNYQTSRTQAAIYKDQAKLSLLKGKIAKVQQQAEVEVKRKTAIAQAGKGGAITGSYLENINTTMAAAELDKDILDFNSKLEASNSIYAAQQTRREGKMQLLSALGGAAMSGAKSGMFKSGGKD